MEHFKFFRQKGIHVFWFILWYSEWEKMVTNVLYGTNRLEIKIHTRKSIWLMMQVIFGKTIWNVMVICGMGPTGDLYVPSMYVPFWLYWFGDQHNTYIFDWLCCFNLLVDFTVSYIHVDHKVYSFRLHLYSYGLGCHGNHLILVWKQICGFWIFKVKLILSLKVKF